MACSVAGATVRRVVAGVFRPHPQLHPSVPLTSRSPRARNASVATPRRSALYFGTLWPQVSASAGGVRTMNLVDALVRGGYEVTYSSPAKWNEFADELAARHERIKVVRCAPNNADAVERVIRAATGPGARQPLSRHGSDNDDARSVDDGRDGDGPDVVVFDRFIMEEQFGHAVHRVCPSALRVLDTQDLHALRLGRMRLIKDGGTLEEAAAYVPDAANPDAVREVASMHRSDLTVMCSLRELELLARTGSQAGGYGTDTRWADWVRANDKAAVGPAVPAHPLFHMAAHKLAYAGFFCPSTSTLEPRFKAFADRHHFTTIGNFRHPPNRDGLKWFAKEVWPLIHEQLPDACMHVYGAYPAPQDFELQDASRNLFVKGMTKTLEMLLHHRVLLAPLRFGAGIKGKIADAWMHGAAVVTTPIGGEGMEPALGLPAGAGVMTWGGYRTAVTARQFADDAVRLYTDAATWEASVAVGRSIVDTVFSQDVIEPVFMATLERAREVRCVMAAWFAARTPCSPRRSSVPDPAYVVGHLGVASVTTRQQSCEVCHRDVAWIAILCACAHTDPEEETQRRPAAGSDDERSDESHRVHGALDRSQEQGAVGEGRNVQHVQYGMYGAGGGHVETQWIARISLRASYRRPGATPLQQAAEDIRSQCGSP